MTAHMFTTSIALFKGFWGMRHLSKERQLPAQLLTAIYLLGCASLLCLNVSLVFFFDTDVWDTKVILQAALCVLFLFAAIIARRGHIVAVLWMTSLVQLVPIGLRMVHVGGLGAIASVVILPIVVFSLIGAKRSIVAYGIFIFFSLSAAHLLIQTQGWSTAPSIYAVHAPIVTFGVMVGFMTFCTLTVTRIDDAMLSALERSNAQLDRANGEALTKRIEAERAMHEARMNREAKATYLANMSHELRTPLTTILSYAEMIEEELDEHPAAELETMREDVSHVHASGRVLLHRINDVLDLSRIEAGKMPTRLSNVRLQELFVQVGEFVSEHLGDDNVHIRGMGRLGDVCVTCDQEMTVKLLSHLILHLGVQEPEVLSLTARSDGMELHLELGSWREPWTRRRRAQSGPSELHALLYEAIKGALDVVVTPSPHSPSSWVFTLPTLPQRRATQTRPRSTSEAVNVAGGSGAPLPGSA